MTQKRGIRLCQEETATAPGQAALEAPVRGSMRVLSGVRP